MNIGAGEKDTVEENEEKDVTEEGFVGARGS